MYTRKEQKLRDTSVELFTFRKGTTEENKRARTGNTATMNESHTELLHLAPLSRPLLPADGRNDQTAGPAAPPAASPLPQASTRHQQIALQTHRPARAAASTRLPGAAGPSLPAEQLRAGHRVPVPPPPPQAQACLPGPGRSRPSPTGSECERAPVSYPGVAGELRPLVPSPTPSAELSPTTAPAPQDPRGRSATSPLEKEGGQSLGILAGP